MLVYYGNYHEECVLLYMSFSYCWHTHTHTHTQLTLSIHLSTEGADSLSLAEDSSLVEGSDQVSVRTEREDSISVGSSSEDPFSLLRSDIFTKGKDHEFIPIKGPAICSYCNKLIQCT